jgi:hypothetical protein
LVLIGRCAGQIDILRPGSQPEEKANKEEFPHIVSVSLKVFIFVKYGYLNKKPD